MVVYILHDVPIEPASAGWHGACTYQREGWHMLHSYGPAGWRNWLETALSCTVNTPTQLGHG